ncbi:hypothetical protein BKA82DRAFT_4063035 [Pisolithus tinctorius]|nr:hypothetical protein BKA82DRAFT_4063035 [Pisolithus tinctorius]
MLPSGFGLPATINSESEAVLPFQYYHALSCEDNIRAQYAALTKKLDILKVYCVVGFSMGGQRVPPGRHVTSGDWANLNSHRSTKRPTTGLSCT